MIRDLLSPADGEKETYDIPFLQFPIQSRFFVIDPADQDRTQKKRHLQFFIYIPQGGSGGNRKVPHFIYFVTVKKSRRVNLDFHIDLLVLKIFDLRR